MKSSEIVASLNYLTAKSQALTTKAQTITLNNGQNAGGPYPQIMAGIEEIVATTTNLVHDFHGVPNIEGSDADSVELAYKEFTRVHTFLLHLLTGKAPLFKTGQPVADVLRIDKDALDALAVGLIHHVTSKEGSIRTSQGGLAQTLRAAIRAHEKV